MNKLVTSIIIGISIIIASYFLAKGYVNRSKKQRTIKVTGLGTKNFTSDLIAWDGKVIVEQPELISAYNELKLNKNKVRKYLVENGIKPDEIVFNAVNSRENSKSLYNSDGNYAGEEFTGYLLEQRFTVESKDVEKVENISRSITELLNEGVQLYSDAPRYYYTKLSDLKLEMISKATSDARKRGELISKNAGSELRDVLSAEMGVFQITGQNSNEDFSWGGTFNTTSKEKTATITIKLEYDLN